MAQHPLLLSDELCGYLRALCWQLKLCPQQSHRMLTEYDRIFETVKRMNKVRSPLVVDGGVGCRVT